MQGGQTLRFIQLVTDSDTEFRYHQRTENPRVGSPILRLATFPSSRIQRAIVSESPSQVHVRLSTSTLPKLC